MATQYVVRRSVSQPAYASQTKAPIFVDSDDNKLKIVPAGSGTTEVEVVDASSTQTLTNKTLTSPTITGATLSSTSATLTTPIIDGVPYVTNDRQSICRVITLAGATIQAGVTALLALPFDCIIERVILDITTPSTLASTIDIGYTAVSAATTSDTLLDGVSGAAADIFDSMNAALDAGANAKAQKGANAKWITITSKTGDTTALVGKVYIYLTKI